MPLNLNLQAFVLTASTLFRNPSHLLPNLTIPSFLDFPEDQEELGLRLLLSQRQHRQGEGVSFSPSSTTPTTTTSRVVEAGEPRDGNEKDGARQPTRIPKIRALVLDKDNTLCPPNTTILFTSSSSTPTSGTTTELGPGTAYYNKLVRLRTNPSSAFNILTNPHGILIVSNTAGSKPAYEAEAQLLEQKLAPLKIPVFRAYPNDHHKPPGHDHPDHFHPSREKRMRGKKPFCGPEVLAWFHERGVVERADEIAVVGDRLATDVLMAPRMGAWSVWCRYGVSDAATSTSLGMRATRKEINVDYCGFLAKMECLLERYLREQKGLRPHVPAGWEGGWVD